MRRKARVTQEFREDNGHHYHLAIFQGAIEQLYVLTTAAFEKGNPTTCVSSDHRSAFSSARVREKRTLPRSLRRRAYVREAATSCSPVWTVLVTTVPRAC